MTSQKTLLTFAIVSVIVSLFGLFMTFSVLNTMNNWLALSPGATGNQTRAQVNVTVESNLAIKFTNDTISWGRGSLDTSGGATFVNLTSEGQFANWANVTPANVSHGFVLENTGTINATLHIKTDKNTTEFIRGVNGIPAANDLFAYKVRNCLDASTNLCSPHSLGRVRAVNDTAAACGGTVTSTFGTYTPVNASSNPAVLGSQICTQFGWLDTMDELRIDINVQIPDSAPSGSKGAIMTAQAECPPAGC